MNLVLGLYLVVLFQFNLREARVNDFVEQFPYQEVVTDYGNIFTDDEKQVLTTQLLKMRKESNVSYMVVTIESLNGNDVFRVATSMLDKWRKEVDLREKNPSSASVLVFFSRNDYVAFIARSKETDAFLPDEKIKEIIEVEVVPSLRHGNYVEGTLKGVQVLHHYLGSAFLVKPRLNTLMYLLVAIAFLFLFFSIKYIKRYFF